DEWKEGGVPKDGAKADLLGPVVGSPLPPIYTFGWTEGRKVAEYRLEVGTTLGGTQVFAGSFGLARSATVAGIPTDGREVFVRLKSRIGTKWYWRDYSYTTFRRPDIYSPVPGTRL